MGDPVALGSIIHQTIKSPLFNAKNRQKKEYVVLYRTLSNWTRPVHCTQKLRFDFVNVSSVEGLWSGSGRLVCGFRYPHCRKEAEYRVRDFFRRHPGGGTQVGQIVLKTARY